MATPPPVPPPSVPPQPLPPPDPAEPPPLPPWPPTWARNVAFMVGIGLTIWETVLDGATHLIVYAVSFFLTGLPLAAGVEKLLDKLPWGRK